MAQNDQSTSKWSAIYSKDKILPSSFFVLVLSGNRGSYEITVICSSLTPWVCQFNIFLRSSWLFLYWVSSWSYIIVSSRNWQSLILTEIFFFCSYLGKKIPKIGHFLFFSEICHLIFFSKFSHFILLKAVWKENCCDTWLSAPSFMPGKVLVLELSPEMLSTNQIAGFQNIQIQKWIEA